MELSEYAKFDGLGLAELVRKGEVHVTQFISHRLCQSEIKRFYRYREGILNGCKSDRCRRLMN